MLDDCWVLVWPDVDKRSQDFKGEGIDHIFVSKGMHCTASQILADPASDHPAVIAVIEWEGPSPQAGGPVKGPNLFVRVSGRS